MFIYVVRPGDTLASIARMYNVSVQRVARDNAIDDIDKLVVGQSLVIRPVNFIYTVKPGDTLTNIANRFGVTIRQLTEFNNISNIDQLNVGMNLEINYAYPDKEPLEVNGFAYPDIDYDTLIKTLPNLTYLSIFSYQITDEGLLNDIDDERLIEEAYLYNVAPIMVVTNLDIDQPGVFSTDLIHEVLASEANRTRLINDIIRVANQKSYYGVCIDFEYIYPADRNNYNAFLSEAKIRFDQLGYVFMTAVAPKYSADQSGLLYEAHDYLHHGRTVDRVAIMTYEWGYIFGPALPVAPINEVRRVIDYAVTAILPQKILMGIPNYGYDFQIPYVEGDMAVLIDNLEAIDIAIREGAEIEFDEVAQSPYFVYSDNGEQHIVHFEDARSIIAKIDLVKEYDLVGVSYWTIMEEFPQNWLIINYYFNVVKIL